MNWATRKKIAEEIAGMNKLTSKLRRFLEEYYRTEDVVRAGRVAGYDDEVIGHMTVKNLTQSYIAKELTGRFVPPPESKKGYHPLSTYLVGAENGAVKIGITKNVASRLRELQNASPLQLRLIAMKSDLFANDLETHLHHQYANKRIRGEWFDLTNADVEFIITEYGFERHL